MPRQPQARAASDGTAPRDLDDSEVGTYEQQFEGDDLDPKQLQEAAGQKKGILRRLLNKFKRKLNSGGASGGPRHPTSPKQTPRSPTRRSPSAVKSATAVRAATGGSSAASTRRPSAHMATLPPWKQPNSGSNANNTTGSTGSNSAGVTAASTSAATVSSPAMPGHSTLLATPACGSDAASSQLTPRGGGGAARSPIIRSGLGYTGPASPGAIAARPRPQLGTASSGNGAASGEKPQASPRCDAEATGRRRSQRGGGEGSEGGGACAAVTAYDTLYGIGQPGGDGGGTPDLAFSEVLLSEMASLRRLPSASIPASHGGLGGAAAVQHAVFPDDWRAPDGGGFGVAPYPPDADDGRSHRARRQSGNRPQGGSAAVAAAALTAAVNDVAAGGIGGGTTNGGGGGTLGAEAIAGELSALVSSLDEELASVAAARSKHSLRLKLVGSLLEMMPAGGGDHRAAAGTSGALGGRLAAERERLVSDLEELSSREKLLSYARREWGKVMTVMSGVRVSRKQAGPLQAILFSDTLARIRAFQKAQAKRTGRRGRGGARGTAAALTSAGSHVQGGYAQSASNLAGRWQMHQQQPPQSQSQSQPRLQVQGLAALGQPSGGQGSAVASGIQRRCVQSSSSDAFASQHQHQPLGVRVGPHHPHAMYASQQQPYLPMAGMTAGSGGPGLKGPGSQQLLAPHHLVLAPITEDDCSPQKQLQPGQSAHYGEPYWIPEHPGPSSEAHCAVAPLRLDGFAGGSSTTDNIQLRQLHQRGFVPNRYQQQPHHHHLRQNPYQKAAGRGGYGGGSAYGSVYSGVYDEGTYSDSGSSCSSGEMYRSIASLARNTVDGDDDFGDDRLREVEESYGHKEDASHLPVRPPPQQHRQRRQQLQQLPPPESYNSGAPGGRRNSRLEMAQSNTTAAAVRAHDVGDDDDDDSCSSSGSLESAFITKCLTYTRNSLEIRGRAGGGGASAAAAASAASAAALAAAAAAAGGMSRLSRADRQLYSAAIQTLRANILNTANGNSAAITATLTTGAGITGMTLDTAAGVAGSPADANARPDFDLLDMEADTVYGDIERRNDGYFDVGPGGPHGRGSSRGGGDPTATPTSATVLASGTNASSLGSVEDMLAAVAMLQGGGAGVGSSGPAQEAAWR